MKDTIQTLCFYSFLIFFVTCPIKIKAQTKLPNEMEVKIDRIFNNFNDFNKPGAVIAIIKNQEVVFKKAYGSANLEYDIPNSPSTIFHVASLAKQFTVFSILLLEKEEKLSFDDDIRKYLPEIPDFGSTITIRHLAGHTSGLRDQWRLLRLAGWRPDDVITKKHIFDVIIQQKELNSMPGEAYNYCNTGSTLLAEIVARVSGKTFADFTEENIFNPLNMNSTFFYDNHEKIVKNKAYSYHKTKDRSFGKSILNLSHVGATGLLTTVEDLALWVMNFSTNTVGDKKIIDKMNTLAVLNTGETFGGAYGQFVKKYKGLNLIDHGGADAGYRSYLGRFPDQNYAVIVFSNLAQSNPERLGLQVTELFLGNEFIEEKKSKDVPKNKSPFITLSNAQLEKVSGYYWNDNNFYHRKIYVRNDTLRYFRSKYSENALAPVSPIEFKMLDVSADLKVEFKAVNGKRQMIVTSNDGNPSIYSEFNPPNYSNFNLQVFTGEYYSPELNTSYRIDLRDNNLTISHPRINTYTIKAANHDIFKSPNYNFKFERNDDHQITGFRVSDSRVKKLWFEKVK